MDPSEFEDTVEKSADVVNAGMLEDFFQGKFEDVSPPDLTPCVEDVTKLVTSLNELSERIPSQNDIEGLMNENDENAIKLADMKEATVQRRRNLISVVKKFYSTDLEPALTQITEQTEGDTNSQEEDDKRQSLATASREVVELFKREYDFLLTANKLSDQSFLAAYKLCHAMPELRRVAGEAKETLAKHQSTLKKANESLCKERDREQAKGDAAKHSEAHDAHSLTSSISLSDFVPSAALSKAQQAHEAQLTRLREELERERESHLGELVALKSRHEMERKTAEHALQNKYEEEALRQQQRMEALLANKDEKMQFLAAELQNQQLRALEVDEKRIQLENEGKRRQQSEEKAQLAMLELAVLQEERQSWLRERDALQASQQQVLERLESSTSHWEKERESLRERLAAVEEELSRRPPLDLALFLERIGRGAAVDQSVDAAPRWSEVEVIVVDQFRRVESDVVSLRLKEQQRETAVSSLSKQVDELDSRLKRKEAELATAEKDLCLAHEALQQQRHQRAAQHAQDLASKTRGRGAAARPLSVSADSASPQDEAVSALLGWAEDGDDGGENSENTASASTSSGMLQVVQSQRDRFMKSTRDLEIKLNELQGKLERVERDNLTQRNDNMELYRRIRVLRAGQGKPNNDSLSISRRSAKREDDEESAGIDVEQKYGPMYEEEKLSPFKIAELEKQQYLSRMNVMDRSVAWIYRNIMQDPWMRHAFLVYLAFVHMLALSYVFQVLNPQLIDEVDAHLKAKWSQETLSLPEHPDV